MHNKYFVRQDGAQFYLYSDKNENALEVTITYPHRVRDFDMTRAQQARQWFKGLATKWGLAVTFEGEEKQPHFDEFQQ